MVVFDRMVSGEDIVYRSGFKIWVKFCVLINDRDEVNILKGYFSMIDGSVYDS